MPAPLAARGPFPVRAREIGPDLARVGWLHDGATLVLVDMSLTLARKLFRDGVWLEPSP
jgi:hypothetical protein